MSSISSFHSILPSHSFDTYVSSRPCPLSTSPRLFHSEADFHYLADETLDAIQDAMEELFEEISSDDEHELEVNCASGVLTIALPPHGTWVINKQTPNRQLWWSSPISGPRRYEYDNGQWVFTRSMDEDGLAKSTLTDALREEIQELYNVNLSFDV
jgi:frataxin